MRKRSICVTQQQHMPLDNAIPDRWQPLSSTLRKPPPVCACATVEHRGWCRRRRRMRCVTTPPGAVPHRPASGTAARVHGDTQTVDDAAQCAAVARSAHGRPPAWRWVGGSTSSTGSSPGPHTPAVATAYTAATPAARSGVVRQAWLLCCEHLLQDGIVQQRSSEQVVEPLGFLFQFTQPLGLIDV